MGREIEQQEDSVLVVMGAVYMWRNKEWGRNMPRDVGLSMIILVLLGRIFSNDTHYFSLCFYRTLCCTLYLEIAAEKVQGGAIYDTHGLEILLPAHHAQS